MRLEEQERRQALREGRAAPSESQGDQEGYLAYMSRQVQERTERLGLAGDSMDRLEENSSNFASDVGKYIQNQKRKAVFGGKSSTLRRPGTYGRALSPSPLRPETYKTDRCITPSLQLSVPSLAFRVSRLIELSLCKRPIQVRHEVFVLRRHGESEIGPCEAGGPAGIVAVRKIHFSPYSLSLSRKNECNFAFHQDGSKWRRLPETCPGLCHESL